MTPGKSQSFSHRKEKEIACDDLAMRDVGEEATHYELDRFDEEAWRDLDSECTPLIDL